MVLVLGLVAGCKKKDEAAPVPTPTPAPQPVPARAADAAAMVDAGPTPDADDDKDPPTILDTEMIGPLKFGLDGVAVEKALGKPHSKTKPIDEAATGEIVSNWTWKGIDLEMSGEAKTGPWKISFIHIKPGATLATRKGIRIGSTLAEVKKAYPDRAKDTTDPNQYLVGSVYGGLMFQFKAGKVDDIRMGELAE